MVVAEEVFGIVFGFDCRQADVAAGVGGFCARFVAGVDIIDIDRILGERTQGGPGIANPADVRLCFGRIGPASGDDQVVDESRSLNAVEPGSMRAAEPPMCSRLTARCEAGTAAKRAIIVSIASALNSARKFDFQ